jgi:RNA-directed DNA polymerase
MHRNREISGSPVEDGNGGAQREVQGRKPKMNDQEKSDGPVVPGKPPNKPRHRRRAQGHGEPYTGTKVETLDTAKGEPTAGQPEGDAGAEGVEGRGPAKGNAGQQNAHRTQRRGSAPSALARVREAARRDRKARFTSLFHHITVDALRGSFCALQRDAAPGVDGVTWSQYREDLESNLEDLYGRLHRGAYRAKPSRRVFIPKADGRLRPLGIASLEDKIVQRAVAEVLNAIYEVDFLGFSYGFRPGRSQHNALDALYVGIQSRKVNWVLDADIRGFFDAVDHEWAAQVRRAPDSRQATPATHPEMVEGRGPGQRKEDGERGGNAPRGDDFAPDGEYLYALRLRPLGSVGGQADPREADAISGPV